MLSLVDKNPMMENEPQKLSNNNSQEAVELLGLSSSDSLDSPLFSQFQAPKKRKVRFKKPFRPNSRSKAGRSSSSKSCKCEIVETLKIFSYFALLAIVGALLWYVMTLSTRIQELQAKFSDTLIYLHLGLREDIDLLRAHLQKVEAGNKNTPEALHVIHSSLKQLDSNVTMLYIDVRKNSAELENISSEVKHLKEVASSLKESIAAAPAIQQLPKDMQALSESVANFGSKMNALESNVKELKDQQSNLQTTAQNLSGELDVVKINIQELSNSSDLQTKSSVNTPVKDSKLQNALQEANQHINFLQGQLTNVLTSVNQLNTSLSNQLSVYSELPAKIETVKEAIVFINNETNVQHARLYSLENFIHANITMRIDLLESEGQHYNKESEEYLNKTITEVILHLLNENVFHMDTVNPSLQPLEKTHDVLVLLAALLKNFRLIPDTYILSYNNATDSVKTMLHEAFQEISKEHASNVQIGKQNAKASTKTSSEDSGMKQSSNLGNVTSSEQTFVSNSASQVKDDHHNDLWARV